MHAHSNYDEFNRICNIAQTVLVKQICTKEEYRATYLSSDDKEFLDKYEMAVLLVELCDFAGIGADRMYLLERF